MGKSVARDIVDIINENVNLPYIKGTDIFYARMPTDPQDCIVIYDNAGPPPMLQYIKSRSTYEYAAVMVRVRNTNYDGAYESIEAIRIYLHGLHGVEINDSHYTLIQAVNAVGVLHFDENDRPVLFQNFSIQRKPV